MGVFILILLVLLFVDLPAWAWFALLIAAIYV